MSPSSSVQDVSEAQFDTAVLARSRELPVVVDFWAEWCAPCRMLGPILEREVEALGGRVLLAKVDADQAPGLGQRYGVRGIPAVMAFRNGEVVADFVGARDAAFVRGWLAGLAPSPAKQALEAAKTDADLEALLADAEVGTAARLALAERHLAAGRATEAATLLEVVPRRGAEGERADALLKAVAFARDAEAFGGEAKAREVLADAPGDLDARWALASALAAKGDVAGALEAFLEVVTVKRAYRDDGARKAMLVLFERLGPQHELTREFRRRLQVVL
jgi:putative thioredoxin